MILNTPSAVIGIEPEILLRLGTAAVIGMLLGLDREVRGRAAGVRTHGLICFAAAAMTVSMLSLYLQLSAHGGAIRMDPLRIFEAVGAFIGIVGAGLIVFSKGRLHNLTTAANLWLAAVIGVACGAGQWPLVIVCAAISLVMITLVRMVEKKFEGRHEEDAPKERTDEP
jgi:putative Mg2+ transporter-C (MgtC) family protein